MFADIMSFTAMMEEDEDRAMQLREKLKTKLESETRLHSGRILKFSGDGALCIFDSAIESVKAACAVQLAMQEEPKVPLRIGIHQADVIFEESDVHGDGVNIASRLESLAIPGSILISGKVYDDIKNHKEVQTFPLGKYSLKNVKEPVEVFAVSNPGMQVPRHIKLEGKGVKFRPHKSLKAQKIRFTRIVFAVLVLGMLSYLFGVPWINELNARYKLLPEIQKLANGSYFPATQALDLAIQASKYIPNDSELVRLWPTISDTVSIETEPSGAEVLWKDYDSPDANWRSAGFTPLTNVKFPRSYLRMEIRKKGYQTIEFAGPSQWSKLSTVIAHLKLDQVGALPENMVRIPRNPKKDGSDLGIVGLEANGGKAVGEFLIDRYEVSNIQYKAFMDAGGYTNKAYWSYPMYWNGKELPLQEAVKKFVDRTGRLGPATWEAGTYPDGQQNYPVTGLSWYEAAAYAAYAHKQLPTVYHWNIVAETSRTEFIIPVSNFNGKSTTPVGSMADLNTFGVYDLAGNAREWCFNESNVPGQRFILGGGWNDPYYSFNDAFTQPEFDRSEANGFRCIKELPGDTTMVQLTKKVTMAWRDFRKEKPVDEKTFNLFLNQFAYDKSPLNAKVEATIDGDFWTAEKVTFDAGYNNERMEAYLYLPKNYEKPFQTILYFPHSGVINASNFNPKSITLLGFILKSGRAIVYPIYKGTNNRHDDLKSDLPDETVFYKDHVIMWRKDMGRTLDYLETRADIQNDKIGYIGFSWGAAMGAIYPAIEKRIKVAVLDVAGLAMQKALPEADQINFLPRVTQPVLMLNGKYDMFFPLETSQKPMYDLLGTALKDKKMIVYPTGHMAPRTEVEKEALNWFDKYLGPVK
jgi:eukaryotic-like serine/threonine-protein kinase